MHVIIRNPSKDDILEVLDSEDCIVGLQRINNEFNNTTVVVLSGDRIEGFDAAYFKLRMDAIIIEHDALECLIYSGVDNLHHLFWSADLWKENNNIRIAECMWSIMGDHIEPEEVEWLVRELKLVPDHLVDELTKQILLVHEREKENV